MGVALGAVSEVLETGSNDVLVVRSAGGREALIPNIEGIADVRMPEGRVIVHPIPGLLDGHAGASAADDAGER